MGGGGKRNRYNITVTAKHGSAVPWQSVLDADPFEKDVKTRDGDLTVEKGLIMILMFGYILMISRGLLRVVVVNIELVVLKYYKDNIVLLLMIDINDSVYQNSTQYYLFICCLLTAFICM